MIAVAHRHGKADGRPRVGFLTGWGEWRGAFCTTVSHDSHNLTVFGGNIRDMTIAANAVIAAGGGMAVASNGQVDMLLPLPISGLVATALLEETALAFRAIRKAMEKIADWRPPYLVFKACFGATLACNSGPHQTDRGIADVATGAGVGDAGARGGLVPLQLLLHQRRPECNARGDGIIVEIISRIVMQSAVDGGAVAEPDVAARGVLDRRRQNRRRQWRAESG